MKSDFLQEAMKDEFEKIISGDIELNDVEGLGITLNRERFGIALNYPFVISDVGSVFINWYVRRCHPALSFCLRLHTCTLTLHAHHILSVSWISHLILSLGVTWK